MIKPTGNVAPCLIKDHGTQEQAQMATWFGHLYQVLGRSADQPRRREQLTGRNDFVIARGEKKDRCANRHQINTLSKGDKTSFGNLVYLKQPFDDLQIEDS